VLELAINASIPLVNPQAMPEGKKESQNRVLPCIAAMQTRIARAKTQLIPKDGCDHRGFLAKWAKSSHQAGKSSPID
jgi:hypothetical protein